MVLLTTKVIHLKKKYASIQLNMSEKGGSQY